VTLVVEETHTTAGIEESAQHTLAAWRTRVGAFAIDALPGLAVIATAVLVFFTVPAAGAWSWTCISVVAIAVVLTVVDRAVLPSLTGWTVGRAVFGVKVVRVDGTDADMWRLLLRDLAHLLDTVSVVGWLWPLWDARHRTFADMLLGTEVRRTEPHAKPDTVRKRAAAVLLAAAALCQSGANLSYAAVYTRDRATDATRQEIITEGPKIVAQMLTYDPGTLKDDFARARNLATDRYRGQLAAQQEVVEKGHPVINEYRVSDASIQAASPGHATMLLFMQGRRGAAPEERYISATVQVRFVKGKDNRWLVDDLNVLTKPKPQGGKK
jgi:Mce-associated membrane protein